MNSKKVSEEMVNELYNLVVSVNSVEDCRDLFNDLCTAKEIKQMSQRIAAAKMLLQGKTYNQVIEKTDISSATLSRVSRAVQYGDGYIKFLGNNKLN